MRIPLHRTKNCGCGLFHMHGYIFALGLAAILVAICATGADADIFDHCGVGKFTCKDGSCITHDKLCNGHFDCSDNSDEENCDDKMCRKPNWFKCSEAHGPCLSAELVCDRIENCPGGEDEVDCGYTEHRNCTEFEYMCLADKTCIPSDFMCDGNNDCHDGSDETDGCLKAETNCHGFFCRNKKCLGNSKWVCDGVDDCGDGSDEQKCVKECKPEKGTFACHNNETCIPLAKVCDGKPDCPDRSDESDSCTSTTNNCSSLACPPASRCVMLPNGPICLCPKGFRYSTSQRACKDINECVEQFGLCSQICENLSGRFECKCDAGYTLQADYRTCRATGEEALLLYSTRNTVMGVHLRSHRVFKVAANLSEVIGIAYDGENIYWTNIQTEVESIVKAKSDGSEQQILLTSGLDAPEDLAVDWLTGNIYFSDNVMRHIAVCSNDGHNCFVLVTIDVHRPRGIALWPQRGQMFWTDWGTKPSIVRASMDGHNSVPIVTENLHWPNGIALDMHNDRIYWVDAKFRTMESVRPDGTDRQPVLENILKHPYGLAIFEDRLFWSDWDTRSIHSCNKFTGKGHKVLTKDRTSYAVHIYHSAKQPKIDHDCLRRRCSHLCLLAENNSSTCACPEGMQLSVNQQRCIKTHKRQRLFIGVGKTLSEIEHTLFGRHVVQRTRHLSLYISEMAYNSVNGTIIIADNFQSIIAEYDIEKDRMKTLVVGHLGNVTGMAFDHYAHNVYWTDSDHHVVEVFSMHTRHRATVNFFSGIEVPIGIAVIPEDGVMFVALRSRKGTHIDQLPLSGQGEHVHVLEEGLGHRAIKLLPDYDTGSIYWSDSASERISFTDYHHFHMQTFLGKLRRPYSIAIVDDDIFWSELQSSTIHWMHKSHLGIIKRLDFDAGRDGFTPTQMPLLASTSPLIVDHPCQHGNGGCSHVCISLGRYAVACLCPPGLVYSDASNRTCIEEIDCEFRCHSGECLTQSRRCNGRKDCPDNSDEKDCEAATAKSRKVVCAISEFACLKGDQCVESDKRCNGKRDCQDGSDEQHCEKFDPKKQCHSHQYSCKNGRCVDFSTMCDGTDDCGDNSDEANCKSDDRTLQKTRPICGKDMFQCNSGTCIAKSWECDGKIDCTDGSDEHEKCDLSKCPPNMHMCLLGQCIDERLVCDGHNDCGDRTDEINCDMNTGTKRKMICGDAEHPMYQCASDKNVCLELSAKCNGTAECPRGEDEADCGFLCSIYEFQCHDSKQCIAKTFVCDHENDCKDGSDEINCKKYHNSTKFTVGTTHEHLCGENMFDCKNGRCIDINRVCDGFFDCDTGIDETPLCKTACKASSGRPTCQHKCRPTPTGGVCSCFPGSKLDADKRSCIDVNECDDFDPCAQLCENTVGSYRCKCYPEFMLRPDKTTCKSIDSEYKIMFSTFNEVRSMSQQPIIYRVAWSANDSKITGFDLNVRKRSAYFTTDNEDILYKVDMDTGIVTDALVVETPSKVAVDWITDNVYVISRTNRFEIKICSFAAKMCGSIVKTKPRETIRAIAFDAFNQKLFYVVVRTEAFGAPISQIRAATPDGKKSDTLIRRNTGFITAIATDPDKEMLYFVDSHTRTLEAVGYNNKLDRNRGSTIIKQKSGRIMHPSGLTVFENRAYLVNIGMKEAVHCQLFAARDCDAFNLNVLNAEDIVIDAVSRQPLTTNPCDMAKCSGMCLQAQYGYECMCGDTVVSESFTCPKSASNAIISNAVLLKSSSDSQNSHHSHTTAAVVLSVLFVVLLALAVGYLYCRRCKQTHHRHFNINLHFQNPLSSKASIGKSAALRSDKETVSFNAGQESLQPIHRFLHGANSITGSEIVLEPATKTVGYRTMGQVECLSSTLVDNCSVYYASPTNGNYLSDDDDARTRLVP